jgi:hypothetical protein
MRPMVTATLTRAFPQTYDCDAALACPIDFQAFASVCSLFAGVSLPAKSSRGSHGGDLRLGVETRGAPRRGRTLKVTGVTPRVLIH